MKGMITAVLVTILLLLTTSAFAEPIPHAAKQHQRELTRIAMQEFGLDAPVAMFAAQVHQESSWRTHARSPFADGLTQFTPATAAWISEVYPDLGDAAPFSPGWALRAMVRYDRHIYMRIEPWQAEAIPTCDHWAMTLSGYNGGPGWISRDRRLAAEAGADPDHWFEEVEHHTDRADWARRENRHYPRRILLDLEPAYRAAGWRGSATC